MKESVAFICRVSSKENRQLMLKRPEHPDGFQAKVFKEYEGEGVGCLISS